MIEKGGVYGGHPSKTAGLTKRGNRGNRGLLWRNAAGSTIDGSRAYSAGSRVVERLEPKAPKFYRTTVLGFVNKLLYTGTRGERQPHYT